MPKFEGFVLPKNKSGSLPCKMLFYDCETDHFTEGRIQHHYFKMGWSWYLERSRERGITSEKWVFHDTEESFHDLVDRRTYKGTTLYLLGHNIGFDLAVSGFLTEYTRRGWKLDFFYCAGLTFILSLTLDKRKIRILSTTNYFDFSLEALGEVLGEPKGKVDFASVSDEELSSYCRQDVKITGKAFLYWLDFIQDHDLGRFGLTKSSQAFNAFRHRFMNVEIMIHRDPETVDLEREAYMGGRVEAFYIGKAKDPPFLSLDINSMYPSIMKNELMPVKLNHKGKSLTLDLLAFFLKDYGMIAEVEVDIPVPALAFRGKEKILYPTGRFTTFLCTPGLKLALERGWIRKVGRWSSYVMRNIFADYVDFFSGLKEDYAREDKEVFRQMAKYYMNTLYGKFGQKRKIEDRMENKDPEGFRREIFINLVTGLTYTETQLFNVLLTTYHETNGKNTFVGIAAHVTEYGRLMLWRIIEDIGPDKVLYCDTDSIKIRKADLPLVKYPIDQFKLGCLAEEETFTHFEIFGCKDYEADTSVKIKGVPKNHRLIGPGEYTYAQFEGFLSSLRNGNDDRIQVKTVHKKLKRSYDKGIVGPSGWVKPFHLA